MKAIERCTQAGDYKYSVVIPVFNSQAIVEKTIDRLVQFWESVSFDYEIILVNDGSSDGSWAVIEAKAQENTHITAINLLHNYGQHSANICGFEYCTGDYLITMDDDLQNPPEEIIHLINKVHEGYDVVFGRFKDKKHAGYRRAGSRLIGQINKRLFNKPPNLVLSNFRIIRRDLVDRICSYKTNFPYIPGLVLMFMSSPANTWVEHHERPVGKSNYNIFRILQLVFRILFSYSSYPLHYAAMIGLLLSIASFSLGIFYLVKALTIGVSVPGWTTIVILLSISNAVILSMLSMLGEYLIRLSRQICIEKPYQIKGLVREEK